MGDTESLKEDEEESVLMWDRSLERGPRGTALS